MSVKSGSPEGVLLTRTEERYDIGDDEGKDPRDDEDASPRAPTNDCMTVEVLCVAEKTEEHKASCN